MPAPPFLLPPAQMRRLAPHFPRSHGIPRVDEWRALSGIVFVIRHGLRWRDAPPAYGQLSAAKLGQTTLQLGPDPVGLPPSGDPGGMLVEHRL